MDKPETAEILIKDLFYTHVGHFKTTNILKEFTNLLKFSKTIIDA